MLFVGRFNCSANKNSENIVAALTTEGDNPASNANPNKQQIMAMALICLP